MQWIAVLNSSLSSPQKVNTIIVGLQWPLYGSSESWQEVAMTSHVDMLPYIHSNHEIFDRLAVKFDGAWRHTSGRSETFTLQPSVYK